MDGFAAFGAGQRVTLKTRIPFSGVGLHSGRMIRAALGPAPSGTGVVFHRTDLGITVPALFDHVIDTRLCTMLAADGARIGTVEHIMAALAAAGIDDALIELDGPEVPILDGSAEPFQFLIDCAGRGSNPGIPRAIRVLRPVRVAESDHPQAAWAELLPGDMSGLDAEISIDFTAEAIGRQTYRMRISTEGFRAELARARTFTMAEDVTRLRAAGLALGGGLHNAVVVDGAQVLNPGGLRFTDEFVRHKLLDVVGDLALAGGRILGRFRGHRTGHALNNKLLHALLADRANWAWTAAPAIADGMSMPLAAVAAPA